MQGSLARIAILMQMHDAKSRGLVPAGPEPEPSSSSIPGEDSRATHSQSQEAGKKGKENIEEN